MTQPHTAPRILVVDDDDSVRTALARYLTRIGYDILQAHSGVEALNMLAHGRFAAMLCDIRMPGMSGIELLPKVIAQDSDLAVIMLTAVGEPGAAIQCLKLGATDYLIKPVELEELAHSLAYALRKRELEIERRGMEQWLAREVGEKTKELSEQARQVELLSLSILMGLVDAAEPSGHGGRNHSMRVSNLCAHVAVELSMAADDVEMVRLAARLHDLGRVALRDERLRRVSNAGERSPAADGPSADGNAPDVAARILEPLRRHADIVPYIRHQHERWDGQGSPDQLKGDAIPLGSRIIAAANLLDELGEGSGSDDPGTPAAALDHVRGMAGTLLDPAVVRALETVLSRRRH
jgi:response regulator RpfG family c-di-GMP phosphodiesterase